MYMCTHVYTHIHTHMCTHVCVCAHMCMYINTCRRLSVQSAALVAVASSCQLCRVASTHPSQTSTMPYHAMRVQLLLAQCSD